MRIVDIENYLIEAFTSYLTTGLWSETYFCEKCSEAGAVVAECESGDDLECGISLSVNGFRPDDLTREAEHEAESDLVDFVMANWRDLTGMDAGQAGHDFWLTRNRHGAGFWDRGLGERGDRLTEACRPYGEVSLYLGDDGKIYYQD